MNIATPLTVCRSIFAISVFFAAASCSTGEAGFPQIANPPPFDFADGANLRSSMHRLAFEVQRLDTALIAGENNDTFSQTEIVDSLKNIERLASDVRDDELSARHTFLKNDMSRFISTVSRARMSAEARSPRYAEAARVTGGCVNCHQISSGN